MLIFALVLVQTAAIENNKFKDGSKFSLKFGNCMFSASILTPLVNNTAYAGSYITVEYNLASPQICFDQPFNSFYMKLYHYPAAGALDYVATTRCATSTTQLLGICSLLIPSWSLQTYSGMYAVKTEAMYVFSTPWVRLPAFYIAPDKPESPTPSAEATTTTSVVTAEPGVSSSTKTPDSLNPSKTVFTSSSYSSSFIVYAIIIPIVIAIVLFVALISYYFNYLCWKKDNKLSTTVTLQCDLSKIQV